MLFEQVINGLVVGSMYALIAVGFCLIFGVLDKLNFAHSEVFMFAGFLLAAGIAAKLPLLASVALAVLISGALGWVVQMTSFRRLSGEDAHIASALSSLAVGLILVDVAQKLWGGEPISIEVPAILKSSGFYLFGLLVTWIRVWIIAAALSLMVLLHLLLTYTKIGRSMRATADSVQAAELLGINVGNVTRNTFIVASGLAGVAGLLFALRSGFVSTEMGFSVGLKAIAIMAIGGLGNLQGAVLASLLVGVMEALAFHFNFGRIADVLVWFLMIVVLIFRPTGLFGASMSREVRA